MDESASPEGGLPAKYQKLAYEYSKLRAQAQVLKKAVADEQAKNAELKDCLKDKDQGMRKLLQEVESLNFCNQQLTKRVSFLQEELEEDRSRKNKKKHHAAATASPMHQGIIDAELQSRIEENEKLHLQVSAAELEHKQTVEKLEMELDKVRQALATHEDQLSDAVGRREEQISRLTQERAKLELKLKSCEKELKEVSMKNELSESKLAEVTEILGSRLEEARTIVEQNVHFRDVGDGRASGLDVPVTRHSHENGVRALLWQLAELVPEVSQALSTLHTYAEQRVRLLLAGAICGLDPQLAQAPLQVFAQHLHGNVAYLQPIEEAYQAYFDAICQQELYIFDGGPVISPMSAALSRYVSYLNKLLPYVALSLKAGASSPTSDMKCHELRAKLGHVVNRVVVKFDKMSRYLLLLSAKGCEPGSKMCHCTGYLAVVGKLVGITKCLWEDFEDVKRQLSSLMLLEHELPTVSSEARTTDDCLVSSLASVANSCKKLSRALEGKVLLSKEAYQCRGLIRTKPLCTSHLGPHAALLRQRGTAYLRTCQLYTRSPDCVPYSIAIENSGALQSHVENKESFAQQLESLKNKVRKLEEEKEHWMLEWQLLQVKYERQAKDMLPVSGQLLNKGEGDGHDGQVIAEHFKARIKEMIRQNQLADSKAVYYYSECKALQKRLHLAEQHKVELENQLQDTQLTLQQLRDEMRSTARSYEDQLSTMSEHLASMNEKLTQQKDEIDALRHSSSSTKFGKKLKPK
ncbi:protein phosphatase 1 regulatory subunit 21-like isoform X1 [Dermacentor silvarum]|uniref:protein phosphatase 1 regulatory subunit 21-like isoform X1 n=1 Tax=Dermacentor silvarum TaxID=543639 RepID=UPI00189BD194|nr:protein phosphatase 1 regulatory subunit 21-like isoform X1 [Dermacentor silvarum]